MVSLESVRVSLGLEPNLIDFWLGGPGFDTSFVIFIVAVCQWYTYYTITGIRK